MLFRFLSKAIPLDDFVERRIALDNDDKARAQVKAIYDVLSVLDSKASALMRLDGVLLAAAFVGVQIGLYGRASWHFGIIAFSCLISMILCLFVVSVEWKFLGYATLKDGVYSFENEISELRKVRRFRECMYQAAWVLAFVASLAFASALARTLT